MNKLLFSTFLLLLSLSAPTSLFAQDRSESQQNQDDSSEIEPNDPLLPSTYLIKKKGHAGVGIAVGRNTLPISIKYFATDSFSFQFSGPFWGIFWGFGLGTSIDFLYEAPVIAEFAPLSLSWQIGGGPDLFWYMYRYGDDAFNSYGVFGLHANIGFQILLKSMPIDIVVEYHPGFYLSRWANGNISSQQSPNQPYNLFGSLLDFAIAARYYF